MIIRTPPGAGTVREPRRIFRRKSSRGGRQDGPGSTFALPAGPEREERLEVVLHVLYLIFNEGYTTSSGSELDRADLAREVIRLTRAVHALLSVRAHLLERTGDTAGAYDHYRRAARATAGLAEQRHLLARAARPRT